MGTLSYANAKFPKKPRLSTQVDFHQKPAKYSYACCEQASPGTNTDI
jgi:hypothetical protein